MTRLGMVIDLERCVGCQGCVLACKAEHGTPRGIHWMRVLEREVGTFPNARRTFTPVRCNHCANAPCIAACPTGAIVKRPDGIVMVNDRVCVGTMACLTACPYYIPVRYDGDGSYTDGEPTPFEEVKHAKFRVGTAQKCNFCDHRIDQGRPPACVEACPADALTFGRRAERLTEAKKRIFGSPGKYVPHIYGEEEAGGLHRRTLARELRAGLTKVKPPAEASVLVLFGGLLCVGLGRLGIA